MMPRDVVVEILRVLGPQSIAFVAVILQRKPEELTELLADLKAQGRIGQEGDTLRLP